MLDAMAGNRYFSVIDMKSGYHQVEIYEAQKERTVFTVGPFGLYEFNKNAIWINRSRSDLSKTHERHFGRLP